LSIGVQNEIVELTLESFQAMIRPIPYLRHSAGLSVRPAIWSVFERPISSEI
jgi:hypothetical protein